MATNTGSWRGPGRGRVALVGLLVPRSWPPRGESFGVRIRVEELRALDADILALSGADPAAATATLEATPLYPTLDVAQRGAIVTYDYDEFIACAIRRRCPSRGFLDRVVPRLSDAARK